VSGKWESAGEDETNRFSLTALTAKHKLTRRGAQLNLCKPEFYKRNTKKNPRKTKAGKAGKATRNGGKMQWLGVKKRGKRRTHGKSSTVRNRCLGICVIGNYFPTFSSALTTFTTCPATIPRPAPICHLFSTHQSPRS